MYFVKDIDQFRNNLQNNNSLSSKFNSPTSVLTKSLFGNTNKSMMNKTNQSKFTDLKIYASFTDPFPCEESHDFFV